VEKFIFTDTSSSFSNVECFSMLLACNPCPKYPAQHCKLSNKLIWTPQISIKVVHRCCENFKDRTSYSNMAANLCARLNEPRRSNAAKICRETISEYRPDPKSFAMQHDFRLHNILRANSHLSLQLGHRTTCSQRPCRDLCECCKL
jgi:hypothetical protein